MRTLTFDDILSGVELLEPEQQRTLIDIINKRLIEARRKEIARNGRNALKALRSGKIKGGTVQDLRKQLG
ncbi:MAG: hypothetical protein HYZ34_11480 [Ignavibacteriae bacterium]|nr:hypothetical protein [Ignavibacteriota bacterium]